MRRPLIATLLIGTPLLAFKALRLVAPRRRWRYPARMRRRVVASGLFDEESYLLAYPDVRAAPFAPVDHFLAYGCAEGRDPNPVFSVSWYLSNNPDVRRAGLNPLVHYIDSGEREGRQPSPIFSPRYYAERYPDVRRAGVSPLRHYLSHGRSEGRAPLPAADAAVLGEPVDLAALVALKPLEEARGGDVALLASHCPDGRLRPHVEPYARVLRRSGRKVVLVVMADAPFVSDAQTLEAFDAVYVRENRGFDFAAWAHMLRIAPWLYACRTLVLTNDSVLPPRTEARLASCLEAMEARSEAVLGLTDSYEGEWHIQSYFLLLKPAALCSVALHRFVLGIRGLETKAEVMESFELPFASTMRAARVACGVLFPADAETDGALAIRRSALAAAGFDDMLATGASPAPDERPPCFSAVQWGEHQHFAAEPPDASSSDAPTLGEFRVRELALTPDARDAWLILAPGDAYAHPEIAAILAVHAQARPDVDVFYGDAAVLDPPGPTRLLLRPGFDRTQLAAHDYVGPLLAIRGSAFHALGGRRPQAASARLYDLVLRAAAAGMGVDRIAEILVATREDPASTLQDRRAVLTDALAAGGDPLVVLEGRTSGTLQLARIFHDPPPVTLVVPTMQGGRRSEPPHIARLLDSLGATDWPMDRLTVLVGDDNPSDDIYGARTWPFTLRRVITGRPPGEPFNFSAKMNRLWPMAGTEHLVLLNDDVEVTGPGWLRALMTFAVVEDVGAVGARLLFPDGRLQHAGVVGGLFGLVAHAWHGAPADLATYQDWALVQREWSMVTGAVMATRRSVMERVGGFDEGFTLDFNDLDLCLKMRVLGLRVVYTPFAELIHHEKASRGNHAVLPDQMAVFMRRWKQVLDADPAYHPAMTLKSFELAPNPVAAPWYAAL